MTVIVLGMIGSIFAYKIIHQGRADMDFEMKILTPGVQAGDTQRTFKPKNSTFT